MIALKIWLHRRDSSEDGISPDTFRRQDQEDMILHKPLLCMEEHTAKKKDDIFGQYIASEIRSIENPTVY